MQSEFGKFEAKIQISEIVAEIMVHLQTRGRCELGALAISAPFRTQKKVHPESDSNLKIHAKMEVRARGNEFFGLLQAETPSMTDSIQTTSVDSGSTGMQNFIRRS